MDAFTLALLAQAGAKGVGALTSGASQYMAGRDLQLTEEQKRRMKELERMEALGEFGLTPADREAYRAQAMTPVQAAERQALAQFGASQSMADLGQGAAFRQQQAIKQGSEESRAKIAQAMAEKEAQAASQQTAQLEALRAQERKAKQMQRDAALGALGGVAQAGAEAAGTYAEHEAISDLYEKKLAQLTGTQQQTTNATRQMLGITPMSDLTPAQRMEELGSPISEQPDASGVREVSPTERTRNGKMIALNDTLAEMIGVTPYTHTEPPPPTAQEEADEYSRRLEEPFLSRLVRFPYHPSQGGQAIQEVSGSGEAVSEIQGFKSADGKTIIVPMDSQGQPTYSTANPMQVAYFDSTTGELLYKFDFGEMNTTEQKRAQWKAITDELRNAMGEGL